VPTFALYGELELIMNEGTAAISIAAMLERWPMVGRDNELAQIMDVLGSGSSVVIAGEAGVGKTRLARAALAERTRKGWQTEWVVATESAASIPLAAVACLIPPQLSGSGASPLIESIVAALEARRGAGRFLLGVDDAHLLDEASAALIGLLTTTGRACVLATVRSGKPLPDVIARLSRDGTGIRVDLRPLSEPEISSVLDAALDGPVDRGTARRLATVSAGNALYLRELLIGGIAAGALTRNYGIWRWGGDVTPSPALAELVEARLAGICGDERDALEIVAFGEPLELRLLDALVSRDVLSRIAHQGLVGFCRQGRARSVRTGHPIFGEVMRSRTSGFRADEIRLRLAAALARDPGASEDDIVRMTCWQLEAGEPVEPSVVMRAASRFMARADYEAAERLALTAAALGAGADAHLLITKNRLRRGQTDEALNALAALAACDTTQEQLRLGARLLADLNVLARDATEANRVLDEAAAAASSASTAQELALSRAIIALSTSQLTDTLRITGSVLEAQVGAGVKIRASVASVTARSLRGELDAAIAEADASWSAVCQHHPELPWAGSLLQAARLSALLWSGRLTQMLADARNGYQQALAEGDEFGRALVGLAVGLGLLEQGRIRQAARQLRESLTLLRESGDNFACSALLYLASALAMAGDAREADLMIGEAEAIAATVGLNPLYDSEHLRVQACLLACKGELSAARRTALSAASVAADGQARSFAAWALHDAARWGAASNAAPQLKSLANCVDGILVPLMARHARALAAKDAAALLEAADDFEGIGMIVHAAEAAAAAGLAYGPAHQGGEAAAAWARSRELAARCEGAMTPMLRRVPDSPLTRREEEIAMLAAQGISDRAIAAKTDISVRTVHAHLRHIYSKLGIAGRAELTHHLGGGTDD
jgi:DNA-binding CsgD family transcriptional regulator